MTADDSLQQVDRWSDGRVKEIRLVTEESGQHQRAATAILWAVALVCAATGAAQEPARDPYWILGEKTTAVGKTADAWLVLPANLGPGKVAVRLLHPAAVEAPIRGDRKVEGWIRGAPGEPCESGPENDSQHWTGEVGGEVPLGVCIRPTSAGEMNLVAAVSFPGREDVKPARIVASLPLKVQPRFRFGELSVAVASAILGFAAGVATQLLEKQYAARVDRRKAEGEIEALLARELGSEVVDNIRRLREKLEEDPPPTMHTPGGDLLIDERRGVMAYLQAPNQLSFLRRYRELYERFREYNRAVNRKELPTPRELGKDLLSFVDRSPDVLTSGRTPAPGGK